MGLQKEAVFLTPIQKILGEKDPVLVETGNWAFRQIEEKTA
jgi:hypothetical protein